MSEDDRQKFRPSPREVIRCRGIRKDIIPILRDQFLRKTPETVTRYVRSKIENGGYYAVLGPVPATNFS